MYVCVLQEHAFESSQKYKEGKYIIEVAHMIKDNGWDWPDETVAVVLYAIADADALYTDWWHSSAPAGITAEFRGLMEQGVTTRKLDLCFCYSIYALDRKLPLKVLAHISYEIGTRMV